MNSPSVKQPLVWLGMAALIAAILCTGCAGNGSRQQAAFDRKLQRTEAALIVEGSADSLEAAALLKFWPKAEAERRLGLLDRAIDEAADRPDLYWIHLRICSQTADCDLEAAAARLRALDPDNGAVWFDSVAQAAKRSDEISVRRGMVAMAASKHFDLYWNATITHVTDAIIKTHTMNLQNAFATVNGVGAALVIPPFQTLTNACRGGALQDPDWLSTCRQIASVLRHGDTYISELIGAALAKRLWPEGSPEYLDASNARRVAHYRMHLDGQLSLHHLWSARYVSTRLKLTRGTDTEQGVVLADILDAGLDPNPPADWTDDQG